MDPISAAAHAIALALEHEPFYQAISVDCGDRREAVLASYMEYSLREAQRIGRCVLADDPAGGAAAWTLPQAAEVEAAESAAKHRFLSQLLSARGYDRYRRIVGFMAAHLPPTLPKDAWYLSILGVHPSAQGRGIGARLLQPTLLEASAAHASSYLETFEPRNNSFYQRAGFAWVTSIEEPVTRAEYRIFRRDV
jgi:GNAT superfamily N-acetyltransferase